MSTIITIPSRLHDSCLLLTGDTGSLVTATVPDLFDKVEIWIWCWYVARECHCSVGVPIFGAVSFHT
ncbi:YALIH222S02e30460g1_1 [Yarrowia lipolytica]|nr:YALIH222S02e30460g1_1 [Yarrowia lipolytica]